MGDTVRELLERRAEILEAVSTSYKTKPEITDETSKSRSTVNRAINELLEEGLIIEQQSAYKATQTASHFCLAHNNYQSHIDAIANAEPVLNDIKENEFLPDEVLRGAKIQPPTPEMPARAAQPFADIIKTNDHTHVRGTRPVTLGMYNHLFQDYIIEGRLTSETIFNPTILETLEQDFSEKLEKIVNSGRFTGYMHDDLPSYTIAIFTSDENSCVGILTHDTNKMGASLINYSPEAVAWAHNRVDELIEEAELSYEPPDQEAEPVNCSP
ncbi:helix-turn-helix transcriptional regulator [Salinibaculum rarum]|uniref:helix-turn-helix transcriptional regulator n=1 Tax=Salinibaculum rarum TaxID=3058903 RepID=UPI00265E613A|nr:hypothetical protein [Salinibaculum sp. KK48]